MLSLLHSCAFVASAPKTIPFVSLGTGSGMRHEGVDVANATALWIAAGGTGIDTAYIYQDQRKIAAGIAAAGVDPSSLWLTTKIPCSSTAAAKKNIEADLQQLGVDSVDLILQHFPEESHFGCAGGSTADTWKALEAALAAGQTRQIGVSNFVVSDLEKLKLTAKSWPPALNQNSLSVGYHDDDTIAYCKREGITYMAYSPLCGGPNGSSCRHGSVLSVPEVQAVAATHNVSAAQVALKWIVQRGHPLATSVWNPEYMAEDLDLWSWGDLCDAEMSTLDSVKSTAVTEDWHCPVCGMTFPASTYDTKPHVVFNNGQYIAIGGEDCVKKFNPDPAAYLNESLRLDPTAPPNPSRAGQNLTCPVSGEVFTAPADEDAHYIQFNNGQAIYACCPGCVEHLKANLTKYIASLPSV